MNLLKISLHFLVLVFIKACGPENSASSSLTYKVSHKFTKLPYNEIVLEGLEGYLFSLEGKNVFSEVPFGEKIPGPGKVLVYYNGYDKYRVKINFFHMDGTFFFSDFVEWEYGNRPVINPIVSLSEPAVNNQLVFALIASNIDFDFHEVMIYGDVDETIHSGWVPVPESYKVPVTLTKEPGFKKVLVKIRNRFKNESKTQELSVLKKDKGPESCNIEVRSDYFGKDGLIDLHISAKNNGPLFYKVSGGPLTKPQANFTEFHDQVSFSIQADLSAGEISEKVFPITVVVRDIAGNYCERKDFSPRYLETYSRGTLAFDSDLSYTTDGSIRILPGYDRFSGEKSEMYISGGVAKSDVTFRWIPFDKQVLELKAEPVRGYRFVHIRYRSEDGKESQLISLPFFLDPFATLIFSQDGLHRLEINNIPRLHSVKVEGCEENHEDTSPDSVLTCSQPSGEVWVTYIPEKQEPVRVLAKKTGF